MAIRRGRYLTDQEKQFFLELKPEDIKNIEGVDVLIGTSNRHKIYDLVMEAINVKTRRYYKKSITKPICRYL